MEIFRQFQCLALLPMHHIENTFRILGKEALTLDPALFKQFVNYFHNEWIKIVTPRHFCVYNHKKRTTGDAESYNARCNSYFRAHPSFYQFCEFLQKMEVASSNTLMVYVGGAPQKNKNNTSFYAKRSELIQKLSIRFMDDPNTLLKVLANPKTKVTLSEDNFTMDEESSALAVTDDLYGNEFDAREIVDSDDDGNEHATNSQVSAGDQVNSRFGTGIGHIKPLFYSFWFHCIELMEKMLKLKMTV